MQDEASDEIDLLELIEIIWDGKWLIGAITFASVILSTAGALLLPPSFEGRIDIEALDRTQIASFAAINDTPGISQPIYSGNTLIGHKGVIHPENLFVAFVAELRRGQFLSEAYAEIDPEFINFKGDDTQARQKLSAFRRNYQISVDRKNPLLGTLRFSSRDTELGRLILTSALKKINEEVRREHLESVFDLKQSIEATLNYEIDEVETNITNALANYETKTAARLAELTEHAAIARQLGIIDNQAGLAARGTNGIGINVNTNLPLYLRGFKALEKEIALINNRGTGNALFPYLPDYPKLAAKLRKLNTDRRLQRIENGVKLTPLAYSETFIAVNYDLETLRFTPSFNNRLIVVLATLMGSIIAVILVLMRHFMAQRKQPA